jgi:hypothetical protein
MLSYKKGPKEHRVARVYDVSCPRNFDFTPEFENEMDDIVVDHGSSGCVDKSIP